MNSNVKKVPFQEQYKLFVGFDWASDHHDVVAVKVGSLYNFFMNKELESNSMRQAGL